MYRLHGFFTQNTMKTLYVLEELGVEYEFRYVDLSKGEHQTESFRAATPVGRVPVLEHDGEFLFESGAICRYVASEAHSPLFPADKMQRARVDQWMTFFTCHPGRALTAVFFEMLVKPRAGIGAPNQVVIDEQLRWARQHLVLVDAWLNGHDWLANDALSIADPFALAYVEQSRAIDFDLGDFPNVVHWLKRLEAREATVRARALVAPHAKAIMG